MSVPIPQTTFDLPFYFVPYLPNEKIFYYQLKGLSTVGEQSLYPVKKRISEVVKQFYKDTHFDEKNKRYFKYPLTTRSQNPFTLEIGAHDI